MNLFCFSLEGSVESLYEAVQNSIDGPAYNVPRRKSNHSCSRSCSPAVLSDDYTKWRGSGRSISMEIAQMQGTTMKMKKRRTHVSKSASDNEALADNPISNAAVWQAARSPEDLAHVTNSQDEESRKANHRAEVRGGKGSRQPGTKKKDKTLPNQAGGFEAWKPGQDWSRSLQREPSVRANGVDEEPRSAAKRGQKTGKKTGKTGKEGGKKGLNATGPISRAEQGLPFSDLPYRLDRRPYPGKASTLPAQENATPGRGIDTSFLPGGAMPTHHSHRQRLSNVAESSPVWAEATHTCRRPLTEYRLYSHDLTTPPGKEQDRTVPQVTANDESLKQDSKPQVVPRVPRSITDVELSEPNRSTSFGRFEGLKHHPSPSKPEEHGSTTVTEEYQDMDPHKSAGLGKKMKAISLTMRRRMGKKHHHQAPFSEETGDDADRDPAGETEGGSPAEKESEKPSNSLESLYSGQSSSSGVTSESNGSNQRDSLRLEEDGSYPGPFCGRARVHTDFVPSPYDTDSLKLKAGDIISIISKPPMGIWMGMLNNKVGSFKFIYVDVLVEREKEEEAPKARQQKLCRRPPAETLLELLERLHLQEYGSALLLNGYQTVEDLMHLQDKHLIELNVKDPEHRRRLLTAADCCYREGDAEEGKSSHSPQGGDSECLRDSGCFIPSECSDNVKEDGEHPPNTVET